VPRQLLNRAGKLLGLAAANLISPFDPEVLIVNDMLAAADLFFQTLKETALTRCQPLAAKHVQIKLSRLGRDASLLCVTHPALSGTERMKSSITARR
jgi:predicted NBD/HSP70 family sugar kinase